MPPTFMNLTQSRTMHETGVVEQYTPAGIESGRRQSFNNDPLGTVQFKAALLVHGHRVAALVRGAQVRVGDVERPGIGVIMKESGIELKFRNIGLGEQRVQFMMFQDGFRLLVERRGIDEPVSINLLEFRRGNVAAQHRRAGNFGPDDGIHVRAAEIRRAARFQNTPPARWSACRRASVRPRPSGWSERPLPGSRRYWRRSLAC